MWANAVILAVCLGGFGYLLFATPLERVGVKFSRLMVKRVPLPRLQRREFWLFSILLGAVRLTILGMALLIGSLVSYQVIWRHGPSAVYSFSPWLVPVYFLLGLVLLLLPMLSGGVYFAKQMRAGDPWPPAGAEEMRALWWYLGSVFGVIAVLVGIAAVLLSVT